MSNKTQNGILKQVDDAGNVTSTYLATYTDDTLSRSGVAADAKAVGDALSNIEISSVTTDKTLTQEGVPADALAVSDAIREVVENSETYLPVNYAKNAGAAKKLETARTIQTNLRSTSAASFDGSADVTPGVTGVLAVGNGGTGRTTSEDAANLFINALPTDSSTPVDADYYVAQCVNGGTTSTKYRRHPMSALWEYVKGKISSILGLTASNYGGKAASASSADMCTGNSNTANYATSAGRADVADVLAGGTLLNGTEFTGMNDTVTEFWGKTRNITIGATTKAVDGSENVSWSLAEMGLGNVNNTADANKSVNYASSSGKVQTQSHTNIYLNSNWNDSFFVTNAKATDGVTFPIWVNNAGYADGAGNADTLDGYHESQFLKISASCNKNWNWSGQGGQPSWLWGGEDGTNMYVYNPANFNVNHASSAGNADTLDGNHASAFAAASHSHNYLPLSGGTITGMLGAGNCLHMYSNNEGGNISFLSNDGVYHCELDMNDYSKFRLYLGNTSTEILSFLLFDQNGLHLNNNDMEMVKGAIKTNWNGGYLNLQANHQVQCRNYDDNAWVPIYAASYPGAGSSRKYKKNIENISDSVAKDLLKYRVVSYDYINEKDGTNCLGLIAEEVDEICKYPVVYKDGEPDALDYSRFVPQLIRMVQLQQEEIDTLKTEVANLNNELADLRSEVSSLQSA